MSFHPLLDSRRFQRVSKQVQYVSPRFLLHDNNKKSMAIWQSNSFPMLFYDIMYNNPPSIANVSWRFAQSCPLECEWRESVDFIRGAASMIAVHAQIGAIFYCSSPLYNCDFSAIGQ